MFPELKRLIEQMGKDRGIDREIIVKALEDAMLMAARKKLGVDVELEAITMRRPARSRSSSSRMSWKKSWIPKPRSP